MIALGIVTHPKTYEFLLNFVASLEGELPPIYIVASGFGGYTWEQTVWMEDIGHVLASNSNTWEAGAIDLLNKKLPPEVKEFVFLQDTWEFKPDMFQPFWARIEASAGQTLWFTGNHQMYAAKIRREVLDKISPWQWPGSKRAAIQMEADWSHSYDLNEEPWLMYQWSFMPDGQEEFEKCGRMNVRCENEYMIKWKGTTDRNLHQRLREIDEEGKL